MMRGFATARFRRSKLGIDLLAQDHIHQSTAKFFLVGVRKGLYFSNGVFQSPIHASTVSAQPSIERRLTYVHDDIADGLAALDRVMRGGDVLEVEARADRVLEHA
jgi:hypothetical protein